MLISPLFWAPIMRWRKETGFSSRIAWLLLVPLPWMLLAYWTSFYWHDARRPVAVSDLANNLALTTLAATLVLILASVILNRDTRWFFGGWGLVNGWFASVGALLGIMATSGNWI